MMRLIGGLLTVAAFFLCGAAFAGETRAEVRTLESVLTFLRSLSQKLTWSREPLRSAFQTYRDPLLERTGFLPLLRSADSRSYPAVWEEAVRLLPLPPPAARELQEFGTSIGRLPLHTQRERLALCIAALEAALQTARQSSLQKCRSTVALWTLAGLLIALLLL